MKPQTATERKLTRARTQLLLCQPFFGALCLRLKLVPAPVRTLATDGKTIFYNPAFVDSLSPAELQGSLAHEVLHCSLAHHCRRGTRDRKLWNKAADFAINPTIIKNGLALPAGVLNDPSYDNLSAEEIYSRLLKNGGSGGLQNSAQISGSSSGSQQTPPGVGGGSGRKSGTPSPQPPPPDGNSQGNESGRVIPGTNGADGAAASWSIGEVLDATDDSGYPASEAETKRQEHDWAIAAEQAVRSSEMCGHEAADLARPLKENRESAQDWRAILRAFVAATTPSDYRWSPPSRRFVASGLYLPSVHREGVGEIVIGVDTSGSIGAEELNQFASEITAISDQAQPEAIHVVYCDAVVQGTQDFGPSEPVVLEAKGGGGTDFRPVFEWVGSNGLSPVCLIYLTDLCCANFPAPPSYPVLWVTDSRRTAPFGETVRITLA